MSLVMKSVDRKRVQLAFDGDEGLTEQHHKESCDMHVIMDKAQKRGILEHVAKYQGTYGDFTQSVDLQENLNKVIKAQEMFETVPAKIRAKFGNDPYAYIEFMNDKENRDAIEKMGLDASHLPPKPETEISKGEVAP